MIYKNILVTVDGSVTSKLALKEAIKLAKELSSFIRVIHVVETIYVNWSMQPVDPKDVENAMRAAGKEVINETEADLKQSGYSHYEVKLIEVNRTDYRVEEIILEQAKIWPADLIVLGTHGRKGFHHFLLGSVAEGVVRSSNIPVLLKREK